MSATAEQSHTAGGSVLDQVGDNIIHHVSNSSLDHPLIHFPQIFGIDLSVTKHVLMLWIVAVLVSCVVIIPVRKYVRKKKPVPSGWMNALESVVKFIRDSIVQPNVGSKYVETWAPMILTFFFFILFANGIGMIPIFDLIGVINRFLFHVPASNDHNFINALLHGGVTATGNFNVTAGLAVITFFAIIIAGTIAHGFIGHWKNLAPHGLAWPVYIILIPIEIIGMFVKPFALTMRLAANMTGGHIAILAILSFMAIFADLFHSVLAGLGMAIISVPMAVAINGLEIIVILVQAYVFTLLSAVFIGMAINAHH
ncbi:MAG TPA: F0F1 ATP synthase subunit A [Candidatus Marinimicrobia bacterium]|jgi:F-type H+-transporting ATPase subunit a|nr:ATP synthase F0 subunit A [Candidatus Neomarinimicrobiota bacterium]MDP6275549.1 F0F1 ATP synthase subunit A [Candidatus Neomarinimicrobiota bacterium]MDP7217169.1 F0F1 ATP synthase subunit A [Candidatus Neomarinimicrobiota bacterium]HJL74547.1 F0F1 ATP synthase subunit A [Candidatus Neomarinimicrobiota bacterium]HJM69349.1 F0F1 ATP synthase subunit A [Candidatus Neomarinimicrobiota bacterium]|tara:strand:- start:7265 stop:8200 length:936 start_codon:yes stop_codon:yes gene_type:complete